MKRRKRIVIISVIVGSLLLCIMASILVNRDGKTLPLAITFQDENGGKLASYEVELPLVTDTYSVWGIRILRGSSKTFKTVLLKYREGSWHSEEIFEPRGKSSNGMLQFSISMPSDPIWKLQVTSIGGTVWRIGNGTSISSPFRSSSQIFESQVFTNASPAMNQ